MRLETQLYRFVRPYMMDEDGYLSFKLFTGTIRCPDKLSVINGSEISPEDALKQYRCIHANAKGVVYVTNEECDLLNLAVIESPGANNPFHCDIDLTGHDFKVKSVELYYKAKDHGWLYPESSDCKWYD